MIDLSWISVLLSVKLARDEFYFPSYEQISSKLREKLDEDIDKWVDRPELRKTIGTVAKDKGWFKNTTRSDLWFKAITPSFEQPEFLKTDLAIKLNKLWAWAKCD